MFTTVTFPLCAFVSLENVAENVQLRNGSINLNYLFFTKKL